MAVLRNNMAKLHNRIRNLGRDIRWQLGLNRSFYRNAKGARILVYHGICPGDHLQFNTLFIKTKTFEDQLQLYKKYFNIVSLDDFFNRRYDDGKFTICITFDDGFANNYKYVLPLLEKYEVPATFFITGIRETGYDILWNDLLAMARKYGPATFHFNDEMYKRRPDGYYYSESGTSLAGMLRSGDFASKAKLMELLGLFYKQADQDFWLQMTEEEIAKLASHKWVTIGSHSYYHNDLVKIPTVSLKEDLARSKQFLENITGREIQALAFPYGSYNKEVLQEAKIAGYRQLLAAEFLFREDVHDPMLRERLIINPFISNINQMHANITGNYN